MSFVLFGVDRLEAGIFVTDFEASTLEIRRQLRLAKERVRDNREPEYVDLNGYRFEVQGHTGGLPWYDFFLKHPHYLIWVADQERGEQPPIRVAILSETLWTLGPEFAWHNVLNLLEASWGVRYVRSKVGRIDPCVDQDVHTLTHRDLTDIVCRGRYVGPWDPTAPDADTAFDARVWMQRRKGKLPLTGLQLGRRAPLLARCYNKQLEIVQASNKRWFWDLWRQAGWAGFRYKVNQETGEIEGREAITEPWRIEFEVHREVLRAIAAEPDGPVIESVEDALEQLPALWRYLTGEWLRFVDPKSDPNKSRARVRRWWRQVQDPPGLEPAPAATRIQPALQATEDVYARAALGYMASLAGLWQVSSLQEALERLERWARTQPEELKTWKEKAVTRQKQLNPFKVPVKTKKEVPA